MTAVEFSELIEPYTLEVSLAWLVSMAAVLVFKYKVSPSIENKTHRVQRLYRLPLLSFTLLVAVPLSLLAVWLGIKLVVIGAGIGLIWGVYQIFFRTQSMNNQGG